MTHHSRLASLIAAAGIAVGAMTLSAPLAHTDKQTEKQIKAGCGAANGTHHTGTGERHTYSVCIYKDYQGKEYTDSYTDGTYTGTYPADAPQQPLHGAWTPAPPVNVQAPPAPVNPVAPAPFTPVNPGSFG